jgi:hypothetical protein
MAAKYLVLGTDRSQMWDLPDDADLDSVTRAVSDCMVRKNTTHVTVKLQGTTTELYLNGAVLATAAVVEEPEGHRRVRGS